MKTLGFVVLVAAVIGAGLYFGGFIQGSADLEVTNKGQAAFNKGLSKVQEGAEALKTDSTKDTK